jgi:S-adenosylmethionine synthetase
MPAAAGVAACRGSIAEVATKNQSGKSYSISGTIAPVRARCSTATPGSTCLSEVGSACLLPSSFFGLL